MAKKTTDKKAAAAKKAAAKKTSSGEKIPAKKKNSIPAEGVEHLDGLHDYFMCSTKKQLTEYVSKAMQMLNDSEAPDRIKNNCEEWETDFDKLGDKPKDVDQARLLAGKIISQLNYYTKL